MIAASTFEFGKLIATERTRQQLTGRELARRCKISNQYLSDIEHGRRECPLGTALVIVHNLNLPWELAYYWTRHMDMIPNPRVSQATIVAAYKAFRDVINSEEQR